ncbi:MAG TPA: hypothetical protein VM261_08395 [Kofleriaceae bacterium]|nr:hypothetical protein [Kofleriaceae bacterium]
MSIPTEQPAPLKGKRTPLAMNKAVSVGHGVKITVTAQGHKHKIDGGAVGIYEMTLQRGSRKEDLRITTEGDFDSEIDALGVLVVITDDNDGLRALAIGKTPRPLDEESATAFVEKAAESHGLPLGGSAYNVEHGILYYVSTTGDGSHERWRARLGLYTRRIWFSPPRPRDP